METKTTTPVPSEASKSTVKTQSTDEPALAKYLEMITPAISLLLKWCSLALPYVTKGFTACFEFYQRVPEELLTASIGFCFCFFGGLYPTLFAAGQAARLSGWSTMKKALIDIGTEAAHILEENRKDDDRDDDNDGVKDVDQIDAQALLLRKTKLVLTKSDPGKINAACAGLYMTWLGVVATLKVQFACTIALALSIAEFLRPPVDWVLKPALDSVVPPEYSKWIPVCLGWLCKSIAMSVAWYVQRVQSAFTSAVRGGLMTARALLKYAYSQGYTLDGWLPANHEDTYVDELAGWVLAALGFYFQYAMGFATPFPLNLVLFPLEITEYMIQWDVTGDMP